MKACVFFLTYLDIWIFNINLRILRDSSNITKQVKLKKRLFKTFCKM